MARSNLGQCSPLYSAQTWPADTHANAPGQTHSPLKARSAPECGWVDGCVQGWMDACMGGWMGDATDGWMGDGWVMGG